MSINKLIDISQTLTPALLAVTGAAIAITMIITNNESPTGQSAVTIALTGAAGISTPLSRDRERDL